jgi:hypothetical protein
MQVIVRNRHTQVYLGEKQAWTQDAATARPFETPYHALYFCVSQELNDTEILYRWPDGREVRFLKC